MSKPENTTQIVSIEIRTIVNGRIVAITDVAPAEVESYAPPHPAESQSKPNLKREVPYWCFDGEIVNN